jgi:serine/threonine protein phosphatase PrpC
MAVSSFALSHPGVRRQVNEDSYADRPDLGLFAVADGLGGHAAGQVASRAAIEALQTVVGGAAGFEELARAGVDAVAVEPASRLRDAFRIANHRIGLLVAATPDYHGMATTLAAVLLDRRLDAHDGHLDAVVAHVGDSRVYRWSGRGLERLTTDHSWVEEQVRAGAISTGEARRHPWRNLVTRAIGGAPDVEAEMSRISLEPGDRLLLCSDGLSAVLSDEEIAHLLGDGGPEDAVCEMLVHAANLAGGPDNITVVVVTV